MEGYDFRAYEPGDEEAILDSFNLVFSQGDPSFRPRTLEEWRWGFQQNPAGHRIWLAWKDGVVAAHYAAYPYRVRSQDGPLVFNQIVDSFVHPEHRAGLKRPGLFVLIGKRFLEETCGPEGDAVSFGWPIEAAWRMGEKYFGYEVVRQELLLGREPGPGPNTLPAGVEELPEFDEQVGWLYDRCAGEWGASVVRDADYFRWRYTNHPRHEYRCLAVRDADGILRGLAVYRAADWLLPRMLLVMDWLVPPGEPEVAEALHAGLLAVARHEGSQFLAAVFPEWTHWFSRFQEWGWLVHSNPSDYFCTIMQHRRRYDDLWLRGNWWYQLGETDLV